MKLKQAVLVLLLLGLLAPSVRAGDDLTLLEELIRIPSVSDSTGEVNRVVRTLRARMEAEGLFCRVETMPGGREVLFAANERTCTPDVLFSAHLDVVAVQKQEQFVPRRANGRLYGRGASDCKQHCVLALRLMRELKGRVSAGCLFGSDEEISGESTAFMVARGYGARKLVLVLDSDPYAITTRQKGLGRYRVIRTTPPVHPDAVKGPAPSALRDMMKGYEALVSVLPEYDDGSWRDHVALKSINGNRERAEMSLTLCAAGSDSWERMERLVREKIGGELVLQSRTEPVVLDEKDPVIVDFRRRMQAKWPQREIAFLHLQGATDACHLTKLGVPMLVIGVDASGAHSNDEFVVLSSLDEYDALIRDYLLQCAPATLSCR